MPRRMRYEDRLTRNGVITFQQNTIEELSYRFRVSVSITISK